MLPSGTVRIAIAAVALSAATGLGFALWMQSGARMFLAMAETGLSWCF